MNDQDKKIFEQLDGQSKGLYKLLTSYLDKKFEKIETDIASMDALIVTITNSETFQKIIADELEKHTKETNNATTKEATGNGDN